MDMLNVKVHTAPLCTESCEEGVLELVYALSGEMTHFEFSFPFVDCIGIWNPVCGCNRSHNADWAEPVVSMTSKSAPVVSVFSEDSRNRCTIALSETKELVRIFAGIHEEDGMFHIKAELPDTNKNHGEREVKVWIDTRNITFSDALRSVTDWWEDRCGITPMEVPDVAKRPMYSSWYSYHQIIHADELEKECTLAQKIGFHSIIVDDGWQTGDQNRGYAYCGDWDVCCEKIPNMNEHVAGIHDLGMNYLLWFSVPFVGKKSHNWERFCNKMLYYDDDLQAGVLDPRYPDVREFLVETYRNAVINYNLDGLKLDFVDQFVEKEGMPPYNSNMDYTSLQDAVDRLMKTVAGTLKKINPDIMLEFRQYYIGPNIRQYGNIFRVDDCPGSAIRNRVGIIDLRLLSGCGAVHSDMLMWHTEEAPEEIAIQMISCLFGTVQVSVLLENLSDKQRETVSFWVHFMDSNRQLLLDTPIQAMEPHNLYPEVRVEGSGECLTALYSQKRITEYIPDKRLTIVNGTKDSAVHIKICQPVDLKLAVRDCTGLILESMKVNWQPGIHEVPVPAGGLVVLE